MGRAGTGKIAFSRNLVECNRQYEVLILVTPDVILEHVNAAHHRMVCEEDAFLDAFGEFTYMVPGYQHMPKYKKGLWDGKIRVLRKQGRLVPSGIVPLVVSFLESTGRSVRVDDKWAADSDNVCYDPIEFAKACGVPEEKTPRDYQEYIIRELSTRRRGLVLSPTGSGKSLMIYLIGRWYRELQKLLVVPTKSLVNQMVKDFRDYGYTDPITMIHGETSKDWKSTLDSEFVVSTWQSIYKMPTDWFQTFGVLLGDEAHGFKAKSLVELSDKSIAAFHRYGFTGTLDNKVCNQMVLEGSFGPVIQAARTADLQARGQLAPVEIRVLILKHPKEEVRVAHLDGSLQAEQKHIAQHPRRRDLVINLLESLKGNILVLFTLVDDHGVPLYNMALERGIDAHIIHGKSGVNEREVVRKRMKGAGNVKLLASYGTFSQGIDAPGIDNIVFASAYRSEIRVLQSIGRGLRIGGQQGVTCIYDIADDLRILTSEENKERRQEGKEEEKPNLSYRHVWARTGYYQREGFPYRVTRMDL